MIRSHDRISLHISNPRRPRFRLERNLPGCSFQSKIASEDACAPVLSCAQASLFSEIQRIGIFDVNDASPRVVAHFARRMDYERTHHQNPTAPYRAGPDWSGAHDAVDLLTAQHAGRV